jgi:anti-sigma regulatory factor (Ser/Thr protein kinase)
MTEQLVLSADAGSPGMARRFVAECLERWGYSALVPDVELMTSEVATNAVLHVGEPFSLEVEDLGMGVRVTIDDPMATMPVRRRPGPLDPRGRGLEIVDRLATAWGARRRVGSGKSVWFEARA